MCYDQTVDNVLTLTQSKQEGTIQQLNITEHIETLIPIETELLRTS